MLTGYDGRPETLEHLKYDAVNAAHFLRRNARVLAIGTGGWRDVLAALAFGQRAVTGVEVNEDILRTVNGVYGDFTGHLDRDPRVTSVRDEARSYVARSREKHDIITLSLIDTWAATAAGAFVLTENGLYTVEAWRLFLDHLTPDGILTVSCYYFWDRPDATYRATARAAAALLAGGVRDPERHIAVLARRDPTNRRPVPIDIGTVLVGKAPFSEKDLDLLETVARELQFDLVAGPRATGAR